MLPIHSRPSHRQGSVPLDGGVPFTRRMGEGREIDRFSGTVRVHLAALRVQCPVTVRPSGDHFQAADALHPVLQFGNALQEFAGKPPLFRLSVQQGQLIEGQGFDSRKGDRSPVFCLESVALMVAQT